MPDVLVAVQPDPVAVGDDPRDQVRVGGRARRDREERGAGAGSAEHVEQARGPVRIRTVIEGQGQPRHEHPLPELRGHAHLHDE